MSQIVKGNLPITIQKKEQENAINYRVYGTAAGAGVQTENLWDAQTTSLAQRAINSAGDTRWSFVITEPGIYTAKCFNDRGGYVYCKSYKVSTNTYSSAYLLALPETNTSPTQTATVEVDSDTMLIIYFPIGGRTVDEAATTLNQSKLCVVSSSTAPTSYIPYGYLIPINVSDGTNSTDYVLYIGDSQLGENEYLDYAEQKVYKRTENWYNKDDRSTVFGPGYNLPTTFDIWNRYDGIAYTIRFPCQPSTVYTICLEKSSPIFRVATTQYNDIPTGDQNGANVSVTKIYFDTDKRQHTFTTPSDAKYILFQGLGDVSAELMILEESTAPASYIPYLQPTAPPVPFPAITAYKGENTLNSTETVGEVTIKYNILKDISQIYTNNQLYDLIDSSLYSLIANPYDSTNPYSTGDYCIYNHSLYKCIQAISTPSEWCDIYWEQVILADEITGETELNNDQTDWEIIMDIINGTFSGIDGYYENQISEIAPGKFIYCSNLQEISLPNISVIKAQTFRSCVGLTTINTSQVTIIGAEAFRDCSSLSFYDGAECITINSSAFQNCTSLQTVSFPKCTTLGTSVFSYCTSLQSINLPLCTTIGTRAFWSCYSLAEVNLPGCTAIPSYTFCSCRSLSQISLPKVKTLDSYAFTNCSTLSVLSLPLCSRIGSSGIINCSHLESLYLLSTTRCVLSNNNFTSTPFKDETLLGHYGSIYVPASLVSSYKAATNWSDIADRITAYTG